jgi:hypothetical protein
MFEATGWKLEEPEVADQEKYDLIVPTIVKSPADPGHEEVSAAVASVQQKHLRCAFLALICKCNPRHPSHETHSTC